MGLQISELNQMFESISHYEHMQFLEEIMIYEQTHPTIYCPYLKNYTEPIRYRKEFLVFLPNKISYENQKIIMHKLNTNKVLIDEIFSWSDEVSCVEIVKDELLKILKEVNHEKSN